MADIEANGGVMDENQAEKLREYRDNLIDYNAELLELRATVQDKLTEAYDAWNEKLDENASAIEHYGSVIEHYKNIIDIVGKDDLGIGDETLEQMRRAQVSNANDAVKASKAALDANQAYLDDLRQKRAAAAAEYGEDSIEVKEWDEQIKTAEEKVREATETFNDNWANALQVAADVFQDSVT
jgi:predicted  nucleic acid-binding Zn-ribbon protein